VTNNTLAFYRIAQFAAEKKFYKIGLSRCWRSDGQGATHLCLITHGQTKFPLLLGEKHLSERQLVDIYLNNRILANIQLANRHLANPMCVRNNNDPVNNSLYAVSVSTKRQSGKWCSTKRQGAKIKPSVAHINLIKLVSFVAHDAAK